MTVSAELKEKFAAAGQDHVFAHLDDLSDVEKAAYAEQLETVNLDWVKTRYEQYLDQKDCEAHEFNLEPAPIVGLPKSDDDFSKQQEVLKVGEEAISQGRLCAFLVAGGQGTRLGFDGPKGCYPLGAVTGRTLFEYHAEQILARGRRYGVNIPWYIMTSSTNDAATRKYFEENNYLGLNKEDVMFFKQAMVPAIDFKGKLILQNKGSLALSPNGHGGSLSALLDSGAIDDMRKRGVDVISYFQVDNPLVTICDPVFAGYHIMAGAEMSSKVLEKNAPDEKVGCICYQDGKLSVVEYSDLDETNMMARSDAGRLKFWAGSIAIHMLDREFVARVADGALPWHVAIKKVPCYAEGKTVRPENPNGVKFETFVFDALPMAKESVTMEVMRVNEFAPVKNATGIDSAESSRELLSAYAARMLQKAGKKVELSEDGKTPHPIEMSYLYALDVQELEKKDLDGIDLSGPVVLD